MTGTASATAATHVVATAGHVDHGKSTLVRALTGTDPDRLAEEQARGLTIDLGFADTTLPSGRRVAIVDVPGHIRFIRNMLAGVGAVDACVLVVDAVEGWRAQTEEHLRILELLGHRHGVVALTKRALVDDDHAELARLEVEEHLAHTFLAGAAVVETDALAGTGLDDLRHALDDLLDATPRAADRDRPRLFVDRVFTATGAGTVVTGTLAGGSLTVGDELAVAPGGRRVRIRGLQTLHTEVTTIAPGSRAALNLSGIAHTELRRGDALVRPGQWLATDTLDVDLAVLPDLDHPLSRRGAHLVYVGTDELASSVRVLGTTAIPPGGRGAVRLHLPRPLPLQPGDRIVVRDAGRDQTVAGGEVLDVDPVLPAARARPDRSVARVVAERGWIEADELERRTGEPATANLGRWVVDPPVLAEARSRLATRVRDAGPAGVDLASLDEREQALLATLDDVAVTAGRVRPADAARPLGDHPFLVAVRSRPFSPPSPEEQGVDRATVAQLVREGHLVARDGIWFAPEAVDAAAGVVAELLAAEPEGVTLATVRTALGTSRKFAVPLLELLDDTGRTRRRGDRRIAGPRL